MSCEEYIKAYEYMSEEEKKLMGDLFMTGVNYDGHSCVTYGDVERVVGKIILGRTGKWQEYQKKKEEEYYGDR